MTGGESHGEGVLPKGGRALGVAAQVQRGVFHGAAGVILVGLGLPQAWMGKLGASLGVTAPSLDTVLAGGVLMVLGQAARPIADLPSARVGCWLAGRGASPGRWAKVVLSVTDFLVSGVQTVAAGMLAVLAGRFIEVATGRGRWSGDDAFLFGVGMALVGGAFWWGVTGALRLVLGCVQKKA